MAKRVSIKAVVYLEPPYRNMHARGIDPEYARREREEFRDKARIAFTWENRWKTAYDTQIEMFGQWFVPDPPPSYPPGYTTTVPLQHQPTIVDLTDDNVVGINFM